MSTHLYFQVEVSGDHGWWHFGRLLLSGDYLLFALLAGVRAEDVGLPAAERGIPKGLPEGWAEPTLSEDSLVVDDEAASLEIPDTCTRADAEAWVSQGVAWFLEDRRRVTHPDASGHSWLSVPEMRRIRETYAARSGRDVVAVDAALGLMSAWESTGNECRAVLWFG